MQRTHRRQFVLLALVVVLLFGCPMVDAASSRDSEQFRSFAMAATDSKAIRRTYVCADGSYMQQLKPPPPPNGCGPESAPEWVRWVASKSPFEPCCNRHDTCFSTANELQSQCDNFFGACMLKRCEETTSEKLWFIDNPLRIACNLLGDKVYKWFVREAGGPAFEAAQKDIGCVDQRELLAGTDDDWERIQRGEKRRPGTGPQITQPAVVTPVAPAPARVSSGVLQPVPQPVSQPVAPARPAPQLVQQAVQQSTQQLVQPQAPQPAPSSVPHAQQSTVASAATPVANSAVGSSSVASSAPAPPASDSLAPISSSSGSNSMSASVPASATQSTSSPGSVPTSTSDDGDNVNDAHTHKVRRHRRRKAHMLQDLAGVNGHVTIVKNDNTLVHKP